MAFDLPRTLTLPSGRRATIRRGAARENPSPLPMTRFGEVLGLFGPGGEIALEEAKTKAAIDVHDLALADFHVVRAVVAKAGIAPESDVELDCHNCGEILVAAPSAGLETGPWEDGELGDPELDRTEDFETPIPIAPIPVGRVRTVRSVTFSRRTVREALPLFGALDEDPFVIAPAVVVAMGIQALGAIEGPARIASILAACDDDAFGSVTDAFLASHYPLRLACDVFCPKCRARNTVDAPTLREFERSDNPPLPPDDGDDAETNDERPARAAEGASGVPSLDRFVELAHAIGDPLIAKMPGEPVELVVEDGTPAVDDGGVPLLGSYVPPPARDAPVPARPPTVTIYYRTFVAIERDEGPFDWEGELEETIEHELEHHLYFLRGDDPMDEEEHAEIDREALRVVGRAEATRRALAVFGLSIPDFFVRAWPLVLLGAAVLAITLAEGRCAP